MHRFILIFVVASLVALPVFSETLVRESVVGRGEETGKWPADLLSPEGRSRWELSGLAHRDRITVRVEAKGTEVILVETITRDGEEVKTRTVYSDIDGSDDAVEILR